VKSLELTVCWILRGAKAFYDFHPSYILLSPVTVPFHLTNLLVKTSASAISRFFSPLQVKSCLSEQSDLTTVSWGGPPRISTPFLIRSGFHSHMISDQLYLFGLVHLDHDIIEASCVNMPQVCTCILKTIPPKQLIKT
jgi:hypothetical protein